MKKITTFFSVLAISLASHAQMAVNTTANNPDASAMLDVSSSSKGLLIPRVSLSSLVDNATIPAPATSLLVYNTNAGLAKGAGYYYNSGTPASPNWQPMHDLLLPYYKATSSNGSAFTIENYSQNAASTAIKAVGGGSGNALEVLGKMKIAGSGQFPAQGKVLTSDASGNATWEGAVAFSATDVVNTGSHNIATSTYTKVRFAAINYNLNGNYAGPNAANHSVFTVPTDGIYHFDAMVTWLAEYTDGYMATLRLVRVRSGNQTTIATHISNFPDMVFLNQFISTDAELQAGDQVYAEVYQNTAGYMKLATSGNKECFFSGRLVMKL